MNKNQLFKRQITLPEIGEIGQQKLLNTSVLVVGCGGLGGLISVSLASSGIGKLHLIDFDTIDITNLHRQVFFDLDAIGKSKSAVLSAFIKKRAPFTQVDFSTEPITKENVFKLIKDFDVIVDATDSLPTKYLLNDACVIKNKPLVYGSLYKFDGYVSVFNTLEKEGSFSANLRDAFLKMAVDIPNCSAIGTLNSIVSIIASFQVNEVLKLIMGIGNTLKNEILIYNSLENSQLKIKLKKSVLKQEIEQIFKNETYFDASCEVRNPDWLISADELKNRISDLGQSMPILVSVIENSEEKYPFKIDIKTSLSKIKKDDFSFEEDKKYVFVCRKGNTSYQAIKLMKEKHPNFKFYSLEGGLINY